MNAFQSRRLRMAVPALTVLMTAPFLTEIGFAETAHAGTNGPATTEFAATTRMAVRPNVETPTTVKAAPNAVCILHPKGITDAAHSMNLFANSEGEVRFHVNAHRESETAAQIELDCTSADVKFKTYPIELSASRIAPDSLSIDKERGAEPGVLPKGATVREGLSENEAKTLSDDEIALRSFPPRPDAAKSPKQYETWLKIVSQPVTLVPAGVVARPDISHNHGQLKARGGVTAASATSSNWSGFELLGLNRSYDVVEGEWYVPSVSSEFGVHAYSAYWVGLDGDGTSDLVQAGTEQEQFDFLFFTFSTYYAWSELLPNQPSESEITGIPVSPGQDVFTEVWIGNANGSLNASGGYGLFYVHNLSTGQATEFETCLCGNVFLGREAEWIMERPTVNGSLPNLANYSWTTMWNAYAEKVSGPWTTYSPSSHIDITMINNYNTYPDDNTLSTVLPFGSTEMLFVWNNFH